jgi:hypothetical protein
MRYIKLIEHISSKTYLIQNDKNNVSHRRTPYFKEREIASSLPDEV